MSKDINIASFGSNIILLNRWILPIGKVASGRVCAHPAKLAGFVL